MPLVLHRTLIYVSGKLLILLSIQEQNYGSIKPVCFQKHLSCLTAVIVKINHFPLKNRKWYDVSQLRVIQTKFCVD